jgi:hypothetical protein
MMAGFRAEKLQEYESTVITKTFVPNGDEVSGLFRTLPNEV